MCEIYTYFGNWINLICEWIIQTNFVKWIIQFIESMIHILKDELKFMFTQRSKWYEI